MSEPMDDYPRGFWAILFMVIGFALIITADPVTGGNFTVAGYVSLAIACGFGCLWAVRTGFFDDDADSGRTR